MQSAGMEVLFPMEKLAVNGYVEVLRHLRELFCIRRKLRAKLIADPPDLFIGVDAPDFNLGLELALKKRGIPVVHYVSPSIWAWRGERIHKIKRAVTHMLSPVSVRSADLSKGRRPRDLCRPSAGRHDSGKARPRRHARADAHQAGETVIRAAAGQPPVRSAQLAAHIHRDGQADPGKNAERAVPGAAGQPRNAQDFRGAALAHGGGRSCR